MDIDYETEEGNVEIQTSMGGGKNKVFEGRNTASRFGAIQTTTETRLMVENYDDEIEYDNRLYESQMFYFNTVTRVTCYPHLPEINIDTVIGEGLDHCFDYAWEIRILNEYINKYGTDKFMKGEDMRSKCIAIMSRLFYYIGT